MRPVTAVKEPILLVCENVRVERSADDQRSFIIRYGDSEMQLATETEEELFQWMIKVSDSLTFVFHLSCSALNLFSSKEASRIGSNVT
jgi:hypothetical protein